MAVTVTVSAAVLAKLVADQRSSCGATDGSEGAAEQRVAGNASGHCTDAGTDLRSARVMGAARKSENSQCSQAGIAEFFEIEWHGVIP